MHEDRRAFLESLLTTPSPTGQEIAGQRRWLDYVREFADRVETDAYGNAVATYEGSGDTSIAFGGHSDQIGYIVRRIDDGGFVRIGRLGGSDKTVSQGQRIRIHTDDGSVTGVIGQTAIHLREPDDDSYQEIAEQYVDIGADGKEAAEDLVSVGDPATVVSSVEELAGGRLTAVGMDNRVGTWAAAEGLRRAAEAGVDATVHAVSTVQEEIGLKGAEMVGDRIDADAVVAIDVTHATDHPGLGAKQQGPVELGAGPVVARGTANHPNVVDLAREAADAADIDVQPQAAGIRTGTDADAFYVSQGGIPALNLGVPNRYMHTPVEVVDEEDLTATTALLEAMAERADDRETFAVEI